MRAPTPILDAVYRGDEEGVRALLAGGPRLDVFEAAAVGDASRLREILREEPGARAGYATDGWTPLHLAAFFGRAEAVDVLLAHGADVRATDAGGHTSLHHAAFRDDVGLVNALLAHGADATAKNGDGKTALAIAEAHSHAAVARRLRGELP